MYNQLYHKGKSKERRMSFTANTTYLMQKRDSSPRPPAEGEEVKQFHDSSHRFPGPFRTLPYHSNMDDQCGTSYSDNNSVRAVTPVVPELYGATQEEKCVEMCNNSVRAVTPVAPESYCGSIQEGNCAENSPSRSPPSCYKWAQSLQCLLDDMQGRRLFQEYLKREGQDTLCLKLWFACQGVKEADPKKLGKMISIVYMKTVRWNLAISQETRDEICRKISTNTCVDQTIFDTAQKEAEAHMLKTTYPNFLQSDIYIQHLSGWQNSAGSLKDCATTSPEPNHLPTVHEDSELQIPVNHKAQQIVNNIWKKHRSSEIPKVRPEFQAGIYLNVSCGNYGYHHSKYSSFLPASAQDSELQSLSSDAQTDDTMSLPDSYVDCPVYTRTKQKRQQKTKCSAVVNKESFTHSNFIPRTQRLPESQNLTPEEFHGILVKKLNEVIEKEKAHQKMDEQLKHIETTGNESNVKPIEISASNQKPQHKSNPIAIFGPPFFTNMGNSEEKAQDILDQHVSRVWQDSTQHTPTLSPGYVSTSSGKKAIAYNATRPGVLDSMWPPIPNQPLVQDTSMPALPRPDTALQLIECSRRLAVLDDEKQRSRLKYPSSRNAHDPRSKYSSRGIDGLEDGSSHRKQSKKSSPNVQDGAPLGTSEMTVIGYCYGRHSVPYLSKFPAKNITLRQFKSLLSKKGNFRYFFKKINNDFGTGVVFEEVTDDCEVLPLWEGKVFCVIESME